MNISLVGVLETHNLLTQDARDYCSALKAQADESIRDALTPTLQLLKQQSAIVFKDEPMNVADMTGFIDNLKLQNKTLCTAAEESILSSKESYLKTKKLVIKIAALREIIVMVKVQFIYFKTSYEHFDLHSDFLPVYREAWQNHKSNIDTQYPWILTRLNNLLVLHEIAFRNLVNRISRTGSKNTCQSSVVIARIVGHLPPKSKPPKKKTKTKPRAFKSKKPRRASKEKPAALSSAGEKTKEQKKSQAIEALTGLKKRGRL